MKRMHIGVATVVGLIVLASFGALLSGCAAGPGVGETPGKTTGSNAVAAPTIEVVEPTADTAVPAGDVRMSVKTTGLTFVMPGNTNVAGEGHVHFTLDGEPFKMSVTPEYMYEDVAPGEHTLEAELVQNDTEPFSPPVKQEITFTAK